MQSPSGESYFYTFFMVSPSGERMFLCIFHGFYMWRKDDLNILQVFVNRRKPRKQIFVAVFNR